MVSSPGLGGDAPGQAASPRRSGWRNRRVVRARAGTCAMASVNEDRPRSSPPDTASVSCSTAPQSGPHHKGCRAARWSPAPSPTWRTPHMTGTPPPFPAPSPHEPHEFGRRAARHARPVLLAARTTMSYRQTQPLVPSFRLKSATSDFGRPRASSCNDTPYESEITTAPLKLKSLISSSLVPSAAGMCMNSHLCVAYSHFPLHRKQYCQRYPGQSVVADRTS